VPIEQIARLVGHTGGSAVTETVYRKQLRPVINDGAAAMNELFPRSDRYSARYSPPGDKIKEAWSGASINAPDQAFLLVGVTGFEPATSSSRTWKRKRRG
jgi:hypothetical protein